MMRHPSAVVTNFIAWVWLYYKVNTRGLSTVWWGRLLQKVPGFNMAAIQLGNGIWINDIDKNRDNERDYWKDNQPFACIALVAHELWHVLQKRSDKLARFKYISPQIYSVLALPGVILAAAYGSYWVMGLGILLMLSVLLPAHAPTRLLQEAEAYSWNRYVAELLCDNHEPTMRMLEVKRAEFLCGPGYYYMTRNFEEARSFLVRCERIPYTEPALQIHVKNAVEDLKKEVN